MTDHPECRALLRAVLLDPAADAPRLVLADWLDDHGGADRADFIRVQVELARLGPPRRLFTIPADVWAFRRGRASAALDLRKDEPTPAAGERIDVELVRGFALRPRKADRVSYRGMLVESARRLAGRETDEVAVELVMDEHSGTPWPGHRLQTRATALLATYKDEWLGASLREATVFGGATPEQAAAGLRWERGFVAAAAMTLADFDAHAAGMFAEQPLTAVRLADRRPMSVQLSRSSNSWVWQSYDGGDEIAYRLPLVLLAAVKELPEARHVEAHWPHPPLRGRTDSPFNLVYASEADALADLSRGCVALGRQLAGLTPASDRAGSG